MEKVTGIGGVFFRAKDPEGLQAWYQENLGIDPDEDGYVVFKWAEREPPHNPASSVWAPFEQDTDYFGGSGQQHMVNYRVKDLDAMVAQLQAAGVTVDEKREDNECGRFAWATDPEGNRMELWQPPEGQ